MLLTDHGAKSFACSFNSWSNIVEYKWDKIFLVYDAESNMVIRPSLAFQHNKRGYGVNCDIFDITALYKVLTKPEAYTRTCYLFPLTEQLITDLNCCGVVECCDTIEELIDLVGRYSILEVL